LAGEPKPFSEEALYRDCFIQHHVTYYVILNQTAIAWLKPCYASEASDDGPVGGIGRVGQLVGLGLPKVGLWLILIMANSYWQILIMVMTKFLFWLVLT
jgi:hypothetical protein